MSKRILSEERLKVFQDHLIHEEKSAATVEKYLRDVRTFFVFAGDGEVTKEVVIAYKNFLIKKEYAVASINSMLAGLNSLFGFLGWEECKVKNIKMQRQVYCSEEKELSREEYQRLLEASRKSPKLNLVLQTICSTGIRVSELKYFTVEAVQRGKITVSCKGKMRTILFSEKLRKYLLVYARKNRIKGGQIFVTKNGKQLDRSNLWTQMKGLCKEAGVLPQKVFPHNLRRLFARTFHTVEKDIAKLADILGHSNINTTRIYLMTTGKEHLKQIERLGLVMLCQPYS